jgi:hypothetical protein
MPAPSIPDHTRTPGTINPKVTQKNIAKTICSSGWTEKIQPSATYTEALKKLQMRKWGLPGTPNDYEEDHLVPLSVGGAPSGERNLWPEPLGGQWGATTKDQLELSVWQQVCRGDITLKEGQAIFLRPDRTQEYLRFFQLE